VRSRVALGREWIVEQRHRDRDGHPPLLGRADHAQFEPAPRRIGGKSVVTWYEVVGGRLRAVAVDDPFERLRDRGDVCAPSTRIIITGASRT
jgi:hypothetical protein